MATTSRIIPLCRACTAKHHLKLHNTGKDTTFMGFVSSQDDIQDAIGEPARCYLRKPIKKAVTLLMQCAWRRKHLDEKQKWLTVRKWAGEISAYHKKNGWKPPEADLVNILAKALMFLHRKGHARQILQGNSPGQWKIFHTSLHPIPSTPNPPFDYNSDWWQNKSKRYKQQQNWRCENCNINLVNNPDRVLHTHHIFGTAYNEPEDLMALCIACHAEQPGKGHNGLRYTQEYDAFMKKYGKKWRFLREKE